MIQVEQIAIQDDMLARCEYTSPDCSEQLCIHGALHDTIEPNAAAATSLSDMSLGWPPWLFLKLKHALQSLV
jgi:hypothetical protein